MPGESDNRIATVLEFSQGPRVSKGPFIPTWVREAPTKFKLDFPVKGEKYSDMDLLNISDLISVLLSKYLFLV